MGRTGRQKGLCGGMVAILLCSWGPCEWALGVGGDSTARAKLALAGVAVTPYMGIPGVRPRQTPSVLLAVVNTAALGTPPLEEVESMPFVGQKEGYAAYRCPTLAVSEKGTVLNGTSIGPMPHY